MTKKDYIKLAKLISDTSNVIDGNHPEGQLFIRTSNLIAGLCDILKEDNPRFDRERFITACR